MKKQTVIKVVLTALAAGPLALLVYKYQFHSDSRAGHVLEGARYVNLQGCNEFDVRQVSFKLKNVTGKTIRILSIRPDCTCTEAAAVNNAIAPDQLVEINAAWKPRDREGRRAGSISVLYSVGQSDVYEEILLRMTCEG